MVGFLLTVLLSLGSPASPAWLVPADTLGWQALPRALAAAAAHGRPVLLYVDAPWCGPCRRMERDVFPEVGPLLERFSRARLAFDDHEAQITVGPVTQSPAAWARHFGAEATPTFVLLDPAGAVITRATGFLDVPAFGLLLAYVATGAYRHAPFEDYADRAAQRP
jgi:thioredoxin-related protein